MSDFILAENISAISSAALQEIDGFPYEKWQDQLAIYEDCEYWISGTALSDQVQNQESTKEIDLYPLRINPLPTTIQKHVTTLFGEPEDDGRTPVFTKFVFDEGSKEAADKAEKFLHHVWWQNNGREAMLHNGIISHIYGGCVFKASYVPWDNDRLYNIRIDTIHPKNFVGFPDGGDRFRLSEAWYIVEMPAREAKRYGYAGSEDVVLYVEQWTKTNYRVLIDGKPAKAPIGDGSTSTQLGGKNPFGFVPFVYIPHIRYSNFLGVPITANVKGIIKELNLRYGDFGDAVNDDAHSLIAGRNLVNPQRRVIANQEVIDLGTKSAMTTGEGDPHMWEVNTQKASSAMKDLLNSIWDQYRRDAFVPAVADGEDEGSQRSGLTLAIRFWPLTSHVKLERFYWSTALDVFQGYIVRMAMEKKKGDLSEDILKLRMKHLWAPMLPRDREIEVQEWTQRAANQIASPETLIEKAGDVDDIDEERKKILKWLEDVATVEEEAKAKAVNKYPPPIQNTFGMGGSQQQSSSPKPASGGQNDGN